MTTDLPELKYLDEAAKVAGYTAWWHIKANWVKGDLVELAVSVLAHARTLQKLAELEAENAWRPITDEQRNGDDIQVVWPGSKSQTIVCWDEEREGDHKWATLDGCYYHKDAFKLFRPLPSPPKGDVA